MQEIQIALQKYFEDWDDWTVQAKEFAFGDLKPMHAGYKVREESDLGRKISELLTETEQGHIGTVDKRKIALLSLKEPVENVPVLQIMQLRPGSSDPLGLDHVAFYCADMQSLETALKGAPYKWEHQSNPGHAWISLWFGKNNREVKFFDHTSLDLGSRELSEASQKIINS
jgi:hypothetical protein